MKGVLDISVVKPHYINCTGFVCGNKTVNAHVSPYTVLSDRRINLCFYTNRFSVYTFTYIFYFTAVLMAARKK